MKSVEPEPRVKDPLMYASGRVSHAVRTGLPDSEVVLRRQQLSGVQLDRFLAKQYPCTVAKAKILCAQLMDAAKQADVFRAEMAEREAAEAEVA